MAWELYYCVRYASGHVLNSKNPVISVIHYIFLLLCRILLHRPEHDFVDRSQIVLLTQCVITMRFQPNPDQQGKLN